MASKHHTPLASAPGTLDIELRCPVEPRVLSLVRAFSKTLACEAGFEEEAIDQIEMAVDEACANVVRHAYKHMGISPDLEKENQVTPPPLANNDIKSEPPEMPRCLIRIRVKLSHDRLSFQIIDYGMGIAEEHGGVSNIDEYLERGATGGLGIYIIRNFMDEVTFEFPEGQGTILTMTKYLHRSESA